jgi:hypothetical protein
MASLACGKGKGRRKMRKIARSACLLPHVGEQFLESGGAGAPLMVVISGVRAAEAAAWQARRDGLGTRIDWRFTTDEARIKLKRLYPSLQEEQSTSCRARWPVAGRDWVVAGRTVPKA